jgi:SAM-dependent methyltransferase
VVVPLAEVDLAPPSPWLVENADLLPRAGRVLDVACGRGRHALWLAEAGFDVTAIDRSIEAIDHLRAIARRRGVSITLDVVDLETDPPPSLGAGAYDAILGFNYLHRPLMPVLKDALAPGGIIIYETFTKKQAERGHPRNPAFLLDHGELPHLLAPLTIVRSREGEILTKSSRRSAPVGWARSIAAATASSVATSRSRFFPGSLPTTVNAPRDSNARRARWRR